MLALLISGWRYHGQAESTPTTLGVGFSAGILCGAVQAAGPPVVAYWLGGSSSALTVRANIILFFFCTSVVAGDQLPGRPACSASTCCCSRR